MSLERSGPVTLQQQPSMDQELDLVRAAGPKPAARCCPSHPFLCLHLVEGVEGLCIGSGNIFSYEKEPLGPTPRNLTSAAIQSLNTLCFGAQIQS